MMPGLIVGALACAALGLLARARSRHPAAGWLAWIAAVAFAVTALGQPRPTATELPGRAVPVALAAESTAARTALLAAAAGAAPAADALPLRWTAPLPAGLDGGVLGAAAERPALLPLQPEALQVRATSAPAQGRPVALQIDAPPLAAPLRAELRVRRGDDEVLRESLSLGGATAARVEWVPGSAGVHTVQLQCDLDGHRLLAEGIVSVEAAPTVLVLDDGDLLRGALATQGVAAVALGSTAPRWEDFAAVVVGKPVAVAMQNELLAAAIDGLGVFVLAPAFGAEGEPMRALLPVRPLPQPPVAQGTATQPTAVPEPAPPAESPPPPPPADDRPRPPPSGDTEGARMAKDPIEVDKHSIAMVLVVDRSGSMGQLVKGRTKMSYAKTSALRTALALGEGDQVALVTFGNKSEGRKVLGLTDATATAVVRAGIEQLAHANERTFLLSGLRVAHELLRASPAAVKHVVVISDGEFDTDEETALRREASKMRTETHASVSVISIVDSYTDARFRTLAETMTREGGGQFLPTDDAESVPMFVAAEVTRALQRVGRKPQAGDGAEVAPPVANAPPPVAPPPPPRPEPPRESSPPPPPPTAAARIAVRAVTESPLLLPRPEPDWPTLGGAVGGEAVFSAQTLLVAGDAGSPLLAYCNRGLGRVGAFAADLAGEDCAELRREAAFPARFAQWVQHVLRARAVVEPSPLLVRVEVTPPAPTPRDDRQLAALAGQPPFAEGALPAAPVQHRRELTAVVPEQAPWLLLVLVLVAAGERWLQARALLRPH